jgi:hypothetical protein
MFAGEMFDRLDARFGAAFCGFPPNASGIHS